MGCQSHKLSGDGTRLATNLYPYEFDANKITCRDKIFELKAKSCLADF
jgi:hypothetical protein